MLRTTVPAVSLVLAAMTSVCSIPAASGQCFGTRERLLASHPLVNGSMGEAMSMDGNVLAIGAPYGFPQRGSVFLFEWGVGGWVPAGRLRASNTLQADNFGRWVSTDGVRVAAIAAFGPDVPQGQAYVFAKVGGQWVEEATLTPPFGNSQFSSAIAISGNLLAIGDSSREIGGTFGAGAVYLYRRGDSGWVYQSMLFVSGSSETRFFGSSLVMSDSRLIVSAPSETVNGMEYAGALYSYERSGDVLLGSPVRLTTPSPMPSDGLGAAIALDGDRLAVSGGGGGIVRPVMIFVRSGGVWQHEATLHSPWGAEFVDFGQSLDLSGDSLAIGAPDVDGANQAEGAVVTYRRINGAWLQDLTLFHPEPLAFYRFGYSLGLDAGRLSIGVPDDDAQGNEAGGAFAYQSSMLGTSSPASISAALGASASFSVLADGAQPLTYQWYIGDVSLKEGVPPYVGANGPTLLLESVFGSLENIRVMVKDPCGFEVESGSASLTVIPAPMSCPGDANGNGAVNFADITEVLTNFNLTCP